MPAKEKTASRQVNPRKWAVITVAGLAAAQPVVLAGLAANPVRADQAAEAGEAGEAGVEMSEGPSAFLTKLGYFEGTYRIAAELYLTGKRAVAREHLEESHHAFYEDIEEALAKYGASGFAEEADAFVQAIADDASDTEVRKRLEVLLAAVAQSAQASGASAYEQLLSIRELVALAAAEYDGGVDDGKVEMAIEYRDSWGFLETARMRAAALAAGDDAALAEAGRDVLAQLDGAEALYPGLTATEAAADPAQLALAAGWIEIIALRQK